MAPQDAACPAAQPGSLVKGDEPKRRRFSSDSAMSVRGSCALIRAGQAALGWVSEEALQQSR